MRRMMLALAAASLAVPAIDASAAAARYNGKVWRDSNGQLRCKRPNGTTGLIVGAAGGALVGRAIDTHGERATATILVAVSTAATMARPSTTNTNGSPHFRRATVSSTP